MKTTNKRLKFIINIAYFAIIIAIIVLFFKYALSYLAPFITGLVIAALTHPVVNWISKKLKIKQRIPGIILAILVWIIMMALLALIMYGLVKQAGTLLSNVGDITNTIRRYSDIISDYLDNIYEYLPMISSDLIDSVLGSIGDKIIAVTTDFASSIVSITKNIVIAAPSILISLLVSILATVFICGDYQNIKDFVRLQLSKRMHSTYVFAKDFLLGTIGKIITAYLIIMLITFVELVIGFSIIRIEYLFLLAPLITIFDVLPYVGCGTILIPWGIICLFTGNIKRGIGLIILSLCITVVRNIVEPRIVGQQTGVHPLLVLMGVYIGGKLMGIIGIILVPLTIMFLQKLQKEGYLKLWKEKSDVDVIAEDANDDSDISD